MITQKESENQSELEKEIREYVEAIDKGEIFYPKGPCRKCGEVPEKFTIHDYKRRTFLIVVNALVKTFVTWLGRWKCSKCKKTHVHYPAFAFPFKNYVRQQVLEHSEKYLSNPEMTYAKATWENNAWTGYESKDGKIDDRHLWKSAVWRWVGTLGILCEALRRILKHIRAKSPTSIVFRKLSPVHPKKYRSERRKRILERCQRMMQADKEYSEIFGKSIFPQFATRAWRP